MLKKARRILQQAFFEFYRQLVLLRDFAALNQTGFGKIAKKHDKYCVRHYYQEINPPPDAMAHVPQFMSRQDLQELIDRVEVRPDFVDGLAMCRIV